jgi:hypothetical protein
MFFIDFLISPKIRELNSKRTDIRKIKGKKKAAGYDMQLSVFPQYPQTIIVISVKMLETKVYSIKLPEYMKLHLRALNGIHSSQILMYMGYKKLNLTADDDSLEYVLNF